MGPRVIISETWKKIESKKVRHVGEHDLRDIFIV